MFTDSVEVLCKAVIIKRDERQRKEIDISNLIESIQKNGVINPIVIRRDMTLVAGERRLTSCLALGLPTIPARFAENLSEKELQIIELEENVRRQDLPWQDQVRAITQLHNAYCDEHPDWNMSRTADALCFQSQYISKVLRVSKDFDDEKIFSMPTFSAAYNFLSKRDDRGAANAISEAIQSGIAAAETLTSAKPTLSLDTLSSSLFARDVEVVKTSPRTIRPVEDDILLLDFREWAAAYSGPKFNFLHCDFPYGINVFAGKQSGYQTTEATYSDTKEDFWELIEVLCKNRDNFLLPSCHIMFWFSMDYYSKIFEVFAQLAPEILIQAFPLIWTKTDGTSMMPDPQRQPRRGYETALIMSRGDRKIVQPVLNFDGAGVDKKLHPSTKPEAMLKHFFRMFVDEHTRILDPTCGGGSALRAAEALGANMVLGLEKEPEFHKNAVSGMKSFRTLAMLSKEK